MINLDKGQKANVDLSNFTIGLGWDTNSSSGDDSFDLDTSVFILGENKKIISDAYFVFYNNLVSPDGSVEHAGDNLIGNGVDDAENIKIDLSKITPEALEIRIVVTIHNIDADKKYFSQVENSFIRIYNTDTSEEILKYELEDDFGVETAVEFGRLYKSYGHWYFEAGGVGKKQGLQEFLDTYY